VNSTLDAFVERTNTTLEDAFGGTVLHEPVKEVIKCLIGLKIASLQRGLTWVHEVAHVSFPTVSDQMFTLGVIVQVNNSDSAAELLANTNNKATNAVTEALSHVVDKWKYNIQMEALISGSVVFCWLLTLIGGAIYISIALFTETRRTKIVHKTNGDKEIRNR
jgi:hypothetical protein